MQPAARWVELHASGQRWLHRLHPAQRQRRHVSQRLLRQVPSVPHRQQPRRVSPLPRRSRSSRRCRATTSQRPIRRLARCQPQRWRWSSLLRGFSCFVAEQLPSALVRCESGRWLVSGAGRCLQQSQRSVRCSARHVCKLRCSVADQLRTRYDHRCDGCEQWRNRSNLRCQDSLDCLRHSPSRRTFARFVPSVSASFVHRDPASDIVEQPDIMALRPTVYRSRKLMQLGDEDYPDDTPLGRETRRERMGLIADEVQYVIPSAVMHDFDGDVSRYLLRSDHCRLARSCATID